MKKIIEPINCPPHEFPHSEELPEGCIELNGLKDEFGYLVDRHEKVYCVRQTNNGLKELKVIIYEPKNEMDNNATYPVIVYCQGSAFHEQWLNNHMPHLIRMAEKGYVIFALEYRASDIAPFPAQTVDCKSAIRYAKKNAYKYSGDASKIALWGDSSGAHTSLIAGITSDNEFQDADDDLEISCRVNCIVDWYGPTDFEAMSYYPSSQNHYDPDSPEGYELGRINVLDNIEKSKVASPLFYIDSKRLIPPILIMHGSRDVLVPFNQSCRLYEKLKEHNKDVTFYKLNNANHGFLGFNCDKALDIVDSFIRNNI